MKFSSLVVLVMVIFAVTSLADVKMPAIFGDHMVLQQGSALPVWGWASPGENVMVLVSDQQAMAVAGADGKWRIDLEPIKSSAEPMVLIVAGKTNTVTFKDVLVGEVWVCSGQSNMEWPLDATSNSRTEPAQANYPQIRLFKVNHKVAFEPQSDCEGKWVLCSQESAPGFSGVGYYFGREIHKALNIPVGMIGSHWGGTPAQAWISLEGLQSHAELKEYVDGFEKLKANRAQLEEEYARKTVPEYEAAQKRWLEEYSKPYDEACKRWSNDVKKAKAAGNPVPPKPELKQAGPPKYECRTKRADSPVVLNNGMIAPLIPYAIKGVIWYQGESNINNPDQYRVLFPALINDWRKHWGQPSAPGSRLRQGAAAGQAGVPCGDFPFLFVQLAGGLKEGDGIHRLRESQSMTLGLPNTGMAVTIDIGDQPGGRGHPGHPPNKRDVGIRLALAARHIAYGQDIVYSGPMYKSMKVEADQIRISFDHVGSGLKIGSTPNPIDGQPSAAPADELEDFIIAGEDHKFYSASARIDGDTVLVWSENISEPVAVRYAWSTEPGARNLYNIEQLPAGPFRTDDWKDK